MLFLFVSGFLFGGNLIKLGQSQGLKYQSAKLVESVNFDDIKCPSDCKAGYRFDIGWVGDQGWLTTTGGVNILCPNCVWYHTPTLDFPMNTPTGTLSHHALMPYAYNLINILRTEYLCYRWCGKRSKTNFWSSGWQLCFLTKSTGSNRFWVSRFPLFSFENYPIGNINPLGNHIQIFLVIIGNSR